MTFLGLDLGEVTLGIARSDTGLIAYPVETFRFPKNHYVRALEYLEKYIKENNVDVVVLGLPKHMHNEIGEKGETSIRFKENLLKRVNVEVVLWDERLTTKQATGTLKEAGLSYNKRMKLKDTLSAVLILQNYLDYRGIK